MYAVAVFMCTPPFMWSCCWVKPLHTDVSKTHSYVLWYSLILNDPIPELIKEIHSRSPLHNVCLVRRVPSIMGGRVGRLRHCNLRALFLIRPETVFTGTRKIKQNRKLYYSGGI